MSEVKYIKSLEEIATSSKAARAESKGAFGKVVDALGAPQRYLSKKLAEKAGLKAAATSEENFVNLVDKGAGALGIPETSTAGNAAKALAVGAAEVFGDPLQFVPLGKIAKGVQGLSKLGKLPALAKIAEHAQALKAVPVKIAEEATVHSLAEARRAKQLDDLAKALKGADAKMVTAETSKGTSTYKKLMDSKVADEVASAPKMEAPINKVKMGNDMVLVEEAMKIARATGVPPEREAAFVRLYTKARGVK